MIKGILQSTKIVTARMQINFKSKRSPMIIADPENAFPGGSKRKKKTSRINVIIVKKIITTDKIHLGNLGIRLKKTILFNLVPAKID